MLRPWKLVLLSALALWQGGAVAAPPQSPTGDPRAVFLRKSAKAAVPLEELLSGGPPVDGIPSLDSPRKLSASQAEAALSADDEVLGLELGGQAVAYPIRLLNWHEIVNDNVGGVPVAVTYCPLCRSGVVFDRRVAGKETEFGVSGLLYKSDLVLYDRRSKSLWSQILGQAIVGPATGRRLRRLPARHSRWDEWKRAHPRTLAVGFETGHERDYARDPYEGYERSRDIYFSVGPKDERLHPKARVFGVMAKSGPIAVPVNLIRRRGRIEAQGIRFVYENGVKALDGDGAELPGMVAYWFAWFAFHPLSSLVEER